MLNIYVVDVSAESRNRLVNEINSFIQRDIQDNFLIPRLNIKPLAFSEIKFHSAPDICIVGHELATQELSKIAELRKLLPESSIVVKTKSNLENISIFEQFARLGVDDTISDNISALEFFRKIILLAKRSKKSKSGQLIVVESSKGGQGVTSIVAALGEAVTEQGKKVLLVDLDSETQDLSRFLLVKPFINENLQYLLDQHRPVSEETIMQAVSQVWQDEESLYCMTPVADSDELIDPRSPHSKIFLSIFDVLDKIFDYVIVDIGSAKGNLARTLYRIADVLLCVVNNDPASLYSASHKISVLKSQMSVNAKIRVLECDTLKSSLPASLVKSEISRAAKLDEENWLTGVIPFCSYANKWPGSGNTLYSLGSKALKKSILNNLKGLGLVKPEKTESPKEKSWKIALPVKKKQVPALESERKELLELPSPDQLITGARLINEPALKDLHVDEEAFDNENEPLVSNVRIN